MSESWFKRIVYYEDGERRVKDFAIKATHNNRKLSITYQPFEEICDFVKSVDYKVGVYVSKEK